MKSASSTDRVALPRGAIKRFRDYLNLKCTGGTPHKHGPYHQTKRGYGDYLYFQDRAKFDVELAEAIEKKEFQP